MTPALTLSHAANGSNITFMKFALSILLAASLGSSVVRAQDKSLECAELVKSVFYSVPPFEAVWDVERMRNANPKLADSIKEKVAARVQQNPGMGVEEKKKILDEGEKMAKTFGGEFQAPFKVKFRFADPSHLHIEQAFKKENGPDHVFTYFVHGDNVLYRVNGGRVEILNYADDLCEQLARGVPSLALGEYFVKRDFSTSSFTKGNDSLHFQLGLKSIPGFKATASFNASPFTLSKFEQNYFEGSPKYKRLIVEKLNEPSFPAWLPRQVRHEQKSGGVETVETWKLVSFSLLNKSDVKSEYKLDGSLPVIDRTGGKAVQVPTELLKSK
ncbi:MAG: hypothetical protein B7Z37_06690 [Verrucomicrobia bacterium 12-59-8]|nr:MAG: hypothetical protein B7Z37_06690 [Verrucomicrobia bacterium 12-59-8]